MSSDTRRAPLLPQPEEDVGLLASSTRPPAIGEETKPQLQLEQQRAAVKQQWADQEALGSCVTPRKSSKLDKGGGSRSYPSSHAAAHHGKELSAPLGFEPEGSATASPHFTEHSTPPGRRWAENLSVLLADIEGVRVFKTFLTLEGYVNVLDFYFACKGIKTLEVPADKLHPLVKQIYKKYIRPDDGVQLSVETKTELQDRISRKDFTGPELFDVALEEAEDILRDELYVRFLESDLYVQYVQTGGESPGSVSSGSSGPTGPHGGPPLASVPEDAELTIDPPLPPPRSSHHSTLVAPKSSSSSSSSKDGTFAMPLPLSSKNLLVTQSARAHQRRPEAITRQHYYMSSNRPPNPYHVSYAPVSAQDSELASMSSDALTDETLSMTGSSIDGRHPSSKKTQRRLMKRHARENKEIGLNETFIPRTARAPKDRNVAEVNPTLFASILTEKLKAVNEEREKDSQLHLRLRAISEDEETDACGGGRVGGAGHNASAYHPTAPNSTIISTLFANLEQGAPPEDSADSILEEHLSRVWERSAPHSPPHAGPDPIRHRGGRAAAGEWHMQGGHRPSREAMFGSVDSGMGKEDALLRAGSAHPSLSMDEPGHRSHGRHGRHAPSSSSSSSAPHTLAVFDASTGRRTKDKRNNRPSADVVSNVDSGISSMSLETAQTIPNVNIHDPNADRIITWMIRSDQMRGTDDHHADSDRSSSNKRSHQQHKSGSKKSSTHGGGDMIPAFLPTNMPAAPGADAQDPTPLSPLPHHKERKSPQQKGHSKTSGDLDTEDKNSNMSGKRKKATTPTPHVSSHSPVPACASAGRAAETLPVLYSLYDEEVPYRIILPGPAVTLGQFKGQMPKKGNYRYFFKRANEEEKGSGVGVFEEICDENQTIPLWERKILSRVLPASKVATTKRVARTLAVMYQLNEEPVPYRCFVAASALTLQEFLELAGDRQSRYKCYFKTAGDIDFGPGAVLEEVTGMSQVVPLWEGKICARLQKID